MRALVASWGVVLLAAVAGCGSGTVQAMGDGGVGDGPRDGLADPCAVVSDPRCGTPCTGVAECGPDLYCGTDGVCRGDCTADGGECGEGRKCGAHGICTDDCPSVVVDLTLVVPTVILLIDQSGSMTTNFGGRSRWEAVKVALTDATSGVVPSLESRVKFGATLYTSHNGNLGGETCPLLQPVAPALNNGAAIATLLDANQPDGDTPTGESIDAVVAALAALPPEPDGQGGPRIIVLATDGEPDTCDVPNPQTGQARSVAAAEDAFSAGIRTFILSVGSDVGAPHLQDMANAGVGLAVGGGTDAPYYVANNTAELVTAFEQIIGAVRSCTFTLTGHVGPGYAPLGDVRLDGVPLGYEDADGWRLVDDQTLELMGAACDTFLADESVLLTATFPCGSVLE